MYNQSSHNNLLFEKPKYPNTHIYSKHTNQHKGTAQTQEFPKMHKKKGIKGTQPPQRFKLSQLSDEPYISQSPFLKQKEGRVRK